LDRKNVTVHRPHITRPINREMYTFSSSPGLFQQASELELAL
jgi:hypothetical protein